MARSALHNKEIQLGKKLSPDEVIEALSSLAKKHKEAREQYKKGGRGDLARKEAAELAVLQEYLPRPLKEEELGKIVREAIAEVTAESRADLGKVMSLVMPRVRGRAEGSLVKETVLKRLP